MSPIVDRATMSALNRVELLVERVDPGAEFAGLVLLRQALSHEQREVAEASRWLDDGYRELLSLWWLEVGGRLSRADVASALDEPVGTVAVRVQRMKEQLDTGRAVVRAVRAAAPCAGLAAVMYQVGGSPFGPWSAARTALKTPGGKAADYALFAHPEFAADNGLTQYLTYFHPDTGEQRLVRLRFRAPG